MYGPSQATVLTSRQVLPLRDPSREYDRRKQDEPWLGKVTARHAYHLTASTLEAQGFSMAEETVERDGTVRMVLRRFQ
ncbi:DUF1257 domain-containing protein [Streptomyces xiangluensis]|uniref:DUF1257 domain-containing protein n=1 Tax=Streptomyces xiangluensis TaxID=2665720 RepID=A0ABV8YFJ0_9ACTN